WKQTRGRRIYYGLLFLSQYHGELAVVTNVTDIFDRITCARYEFRECFVFALFPSGIVKIFVKHDHGPRFETRFEAFKNRFCRGIKVAVHVQEPDISGMILDEIGKRLVKPTLDQANIAPDFRQHGHREISDLPNVQPFFRQALERIEAEYF